jgi:hypothetical protein
MNRLPSFDRQTSKGELRLFLGLGLAAAGLIGITCFDAARFSVNRDEIATALSNPAAALAEVSTNTALTNFAVLPSSTADERARASGVAKPKS